MRSILKNVLVAVCVLLGGCADSSDDDSTNLRFLNAVVGVGAVDMLVDSDDYLEDIEYLESTDYLEFDTDPHLFQITPSNALTPIDTKRVSLRDDVDYTYIACGDSRDPEAILLADDNERPGDGNFKARIINVFRGSRGLDVFIIASPSDIDTIQPTAQRLGYKGVTQYRVGRSGVYDIVVRNSASGAVVSTRSGQQFDAESVYSVILVPNESEPDVVQLLVLTDRG